MNGFLFRQIVLQIRWDQCLNPLFAHLDARRITTVKLAPECISLHLLTVTVWMFDINRFADVVQTLNPQLPFQPLFT